MRVASLALCLLVACGSEATPTPDVDPEPEADPAPASNEAAPQAEPEGEPEPERPRPGDTVRVIDLPDEGELEVEALESHPIEVDVTERGRYGDTYSPNTWTRIEHPVEGIADAVRDASLAFFQSACSSDDDDYCVAFGGLCAPGLAHERLISLQCRILVQGDRGNPWATLRAPTFVVADGALEGVEVRDMLLPGTDLDTPIRDACQRAVRRRLADADEYERDALGSPREACEGAPHHASIAIGRAGISATFLRDVEAESETERVTIPFRSLDRAILADSALGQVLAGLDGVTTVQVEVPQGAALPGREVQGFSVGARSAERSELLWRWASLPDAQRQDVFLIDGDPERYLASPDEERARALARAFDAETARVRWRAGLRPFLGRARTQLALRTGGFVMHVPRGTLLAGVDGRVRGRDSARGRRGTRAFIAPHPSFDAWAAGNLVEDHDGCVPSADTFIDAMPEDRRARARRTLMTMLVEIRRQGASHPAVAFAAATSRRTYRRHGTARLDIYEVAEDCSVGPRRGRYDVDGHLSSLFLPTTNAHGGEQLVVIGAEQWTIHRLGSGEALYSHDRDYGTEPLGRETIEGVYYPFVIADTRNGEHGFRVRYEDDAIVAE